MSDFETLSMDLNYYKHNLFPKKKTKIYKIKDAQHLNKASFHITALLIL